VAAKPPNVGFLMGKKHGKIEGVYVFSAKNVWKSSIDGVL
jgi:hypothetical protein